MNVLDFEHLSSINKNVNIVNVEDNKPNTEVDFKTINGKLVMKPEDRYYTRLELLGLIFNYDAVEKFYLDKNGIRSLKRIYKNITE